MWAFLTSKLGVSIICGLAVTAFLGWTHYEMYETGRAYERSAMLNSIVKGNEDAGNAAENWRTKYRRCLDAGGVFDFEAGSCQR